MNTSTQLNVAGAAAHFALNQCGNNDRRDKRNGGNSSNTIYEVLKAEMALEKVDIHDVIKEFIANCMQNLAMRLCNVLKVLIKVFRDLLQTIKLTLLRRIFSLTLQI
ncbi:hypothetical protein ACOSQ3_017523 [Xanthoceras sorbifolium]